MKRLLVAFGLCAMAAGGAGADELAAADEIRAGRAALTAEKPDEARSRFEAALAREDLSKGDRFVASIGLGRADIWLGDYPSAISAFRDALALAQKPEDKRAASIGLARALNADEYYAEALSLSEPYGLNSLEPTVESLRAEKALGLEDLSLPLIAALPGEAISGREGEIFGELKSDMEFQLANRLGGNFSYTHDSDHLTVIGYGLGAWIPGSPGGDVFESLRVTSNVTTVEDPTVLDTLYNFTVGSHLRIGNAQHSNIALGASSVAGWDFFEGNADWDYRIDDDYDVSASLDRSPILTTTAIAARLLFTTYSLGSSVRISDNLYFDPAVYHQNFSDGNARNGASLRVVLTPYDLPVSASAIGGQIFARIFHSTEPSTGVYFDPEDYNQAQFDLVAVHHLDDNWIFRALAGGGYQSVDGSVAPSYDIQLSLVGELPGNGRAELNVDRNSFASNSGGGSGYWINTVSFSVAYPI